MAARLQSLIATCSTCGGELSGTNEIAFFDNGQCVLVTTWTFTSTYQEGDQSDDDMPVKEHTEVQSKALLGDADEFRRVYPAVVHIATRDSQWDSEALVLRASSLERTKVREDGEYGFRVSYLDILHDIRRFRLDPFTCRGVPANWFHCRDDIDKLAVLRDLMRLENDTRPAYLVAVQSKLVVFGCFTKTLGLDKDVFDIIIRMALQDTCEPLKFDEAPCVKLLEVDKTHENWWQYSALFADT